MVKPVIELLSLLERNYMDERYQIVSVIGLGYIGLPTAALLASNGYLVHGVDVNEENLFLNQLPLFVFILFCLLLNLTA